MLLSQGNVENACAPPGWRSLLDAAAVPRIVTVALTHFGGAVRRRPPSLLVRSLAVTLATVLTILLAVFLVLVLDFRARVRGEVADSLETDRAVLSSIDARRAAEVGARIGALTANPTFEAAVQKRANTFGGFTPLDIRQSMVWLEGQLIPVADALGADVAAVLDEQGLTMAQAGRFAAEWPLRPGVARPANDEPGRDGTLVTGTAVYAVNSRPVLIKGDRVATLCLARRLDHAAAAAISVITRAQTILIARGRVVGTTLDAGTTKEVEAAWRDAVLDSGEISAGGDSYAYRQLTDIAGVQAFALAPLGTPASRTTARAFRALLAVALGSLVLAAVGSLWLARRLAAPIDTMSRALSEAVAAGDFGVRLEPGGGSRELDDLTRTFNDLMVGLSKAEAESRRASLNAIEALAKALEARDVYTAGHSERVGDLAVRLGAQLGLGAGQLEVLRLGASLHDIGKIGIDDMVLRKPGALTADERRAIEAHPLVGARILRPVAFLAAHVPIVELHHERPDGRGYPYGLAGTRIPLPARIVHLADAWDAMTSDRPYRQGRPFVDAMAEIVRGRGTEFDAGVVDAFWHLAARGGLDGHAGPACPTASRRPSRTPVEGSAASCR